MTGDVRLREVEDLPLDVKVDLSDPRFREIVIEGMFAGFIDVARYATIQAMARVPESLVPEQYGRLLEAMNDLEELSKFMETVSDLNHRELDPLYTNGMLHSVLHTMCDPPYEMDDVQDSFGTDDRIAGLLDSSIETARVG